MRQLPVCKNGHFIKRCYDDRHRKLYRLTGHDDDPAMYRQWVCIDCAPTNGAAEAHKLNEIMAEAIT